MTRFYECFDMDEETPVQFVGVYVTRWDPEWGQPTVMFREVDWETQVLADHAAALLAACRRAEQTIRNLAFCVLEGDYKEIALNESFNLTRDIAAVEEAL